MMQLMNEDIKEKYHEPGHGHMVTVNQESIMAVLYYHSLPSVHPCYEGTKLTKIYVSNIDC